MPERVKVKVYVASHQRALRKGSQLVLTLARAPPETRRKKEKQQRRKVYFVSCFCNLVQAFCCMAVQFSN